MILRKSGTHGKKSGGKPEKKRIFEMPINNNSKKKKKLISTYALFFSLFCFNFVPHTQSYENNVTRELYYTKLRMFYILCISFSNNNNKNPHGYDVQCVT